MADLKEIQLDVDELKTLQKLVTRPRVKEFLSNEINKLTSVISSPCIEPGKLISDKPLSKVPPTPSKYYSDITNYAWDQSDKFMKIYVTIHGATIVKNSVSCDFQTHCYRLMIEGVGEKNYRQNVSQLYDSIDTKESFFKVKNDTVVLMLKKQKEKTVWPNVSKSQIKESKTSKMDDKQDPNASMMKLMKQLYDDGDDEMKRTIAKSFSESQNKKAGGDFGANMDI